MLEKINPTVTRDDLGPARDSDPTETAEWLDALESVFHVAGGERAEFILSALDRQGEGSWRRTRRTALRAVPKHNPTRKAGCISGRHRNRDAHHGDHSLECVGHGRARERGSW